VSKSNGRHLKITVGIFALESDREPIVRTRVRVCGAGELFVVNQDRTGRVSGEVLVVLYSTNPGSAAVKTQ
jgi:hypothetical protein